MGVKGEKGSNGYVEQPQDYSRGRQKRPMLDFIYTRLLRRINIY
jgi:hypothetical protein